MATEQQIPVLMGKMVEYQKKFIDMPTEVTQWTINHTEEAIGICSQALADHVKKIKEAAKAASLILSGTISTVTIPATTEKFIVKDKFKVDISKKANVKISYTGDNFNAWFGEKIKEAFSGGILYGRKLNKNSVDGPILSELGGQEKAETTLSEVFAMMECQATGKPGELLTNGYANIFYVRDITGTLRAVDVIWLGDGWCVRADSVEDPDEWDAGRQVFSRNSSVPQST